MQKQLYADQGVDKPLDIVLYDNYTERRILLDRSKKCKTMAYHRSKTLRVKSGYKKHEPGLFCRSCKEKLNSHMIISGSVDGSIPQNDRGFPSRMRGYVCPECGHKRFYFVEYFADPDYPQRELVKITHIYTNVTARDLKRNGFARRNLVFRFPVNSDEDFKNGLEKMKKVFSRITPNLYRRK
ncbi:MAG: hypothetical protein GTN76_07165 [Candidatus Aenigmarchaeota archaeon]|nr:hypothetical protein [Candidatus Aenigmarchaeota archaeon]